MSVTAPTVPFQGVTLRRLLAYGANTAGGLMTSDPIILAPNRAVADALARIRNPEVIAALAAQVRRRSPARRLQPSRPARSLRAERRTNPDEFVGSAPSN